MGVCFYIEKKVKNHQIYDILLTPPNPRSLCESSWTPTPLTSNFFLHQPLPVDYSRIPNRATAYSQSSCGSFCSRPPPRKGVGGSDGVCRSPGQGLVSHRAIHYVSAQGLSEQGTLCVYVTHPLWLLASAAAPRLSVGSWHSFPRSKE